MFTPQVRLRTLLTGALIVVVLGLVNAGAAGAAVTPATSANWAGYAVTGSTTGAPATFTRVFAAWVQPTATCVQGQATYSAFWVGLGGYNPGSQALEQVGTIAVDVMTESAVGSPMLKARAPLILDLPDEAWFDLDLMQKDVALALDAARELHVPLPSAGAADELLTVGRALGYEHRDLAALFEVLDRLAGDRV